MTMSPASSSGASCSRVWSTIAGRHHDPDVPRLLQLGHEVGQACSRRSAPSAASALTASGVHVVDDAAVAVAHQPADEVGAHPAEPDHARAASACQLPWSSSHALSWRLQLRGSGGSGCWWTSRGRARARSALVQLGDDLLAPAPCRARRPTGRTSRCPRWSPWVNTLCSYSATSVPSSRGVRISASSTLVGRLPSMTRCGTTFWPGCPRPAPPPRSCRRPAPGPARTRWRSGCRGGRAAGSGVLPNPIRSTGISLVPWWMSW